MKISLPLLPTGICRDQTVHDVEYFTMEHMHEYADQAIREFVERQETVAWMTGDARVATDETKKTGMAKVSKIAFRIPLIIKPELDDADNG